MSVLELDLERKLRTFSLRIRMHAAIRRLGILGPSGSGKSWTMKLLAGVEKPDRGRIVWNDRVLCDTDEKTFVSPQQRRIAWLPQGGAVFPEMTVRENLAVGFREEMPERSRHCEEAADAVPIGTSTGDLAARRDALPSRDARRGCLANTLSRVLEELGLTDLADARPEALSGGERQRVALGRVLMNDADLILLDEPFTGLDGPRKAALLADICGTLERHRLPAILISHDLEEIQAFCDTVVVLMDGISTAPVSIDRFLHCAGVRAVQKWQIAVDWEELPRRLATAACGEEEK